MLAVTTGILLGLVVGLRHAFEPDHLAAVSTLVAEARDGRRGALLGIWWGIGHTIALALVGVVALGVGAALPARATAALELGVAAMLVALGIRAIARAFRAGGTGPVHPHAHGRRVHAHPSAASHLHLGRQAIAWRPLVIGLIHGMAGSGALTALVFAELPTTAARLVYIVLFGAGSIAGMALASGLAGVSLSRLAVRPAVHGGVALASGVVSIGVGVLWGMPLVAEIL